MSTTLVYNQQNEYLIWNNKGTAFHCFLTVHVHDTKYPQYFRIMIKTRCRLHQTSDVDTNVGRPTTSNTYLKDLAYFTDNNAIDLMHIGMIQWDETCNANIQCLFTSTSGNQLWNNSLLSLVIKMGLPFLQIFHLRFFFNLFF